MPNFDCLKTLTSFERTNYENYTIGSINGTESITYGSFRASNETKHKVTELAKQELNASKEVLLTEGNELEHQALFLSSSPSADELIPLLTALSEHETHLAIVSDFAKTKFGHQILKNNKHVSIIVQREHQIVKNIYGQIQTKIPQLLTQESADKGKILAALRNISQQEGSTLLILPEIRKLYAAITLAEVQKNSPGAVYLIQHPEEQKIFESLPPHLQEHFWTVANGPKASTMSLEYLLRSLNQYANINIRDLATLERTFSTKNLSTKLFIANVWTKHGMEVVEELGRSFILDFQKILKLYDYAPQFAEKYLDTYLDANINTQRLIVDFEEQFIDKKPIKPSFIPLFELIQSCNPNEARSFLQHWKLLESLNPSLHEKIALLLPDQSVFDLMQEVTDINHLNEDYVKTFLTEQNKRDLWKVNEPHLDPEWLINLPSSLDPQLLISLTTYLEKCHTSIDQLTDKDKQALYDWSKLPLQRQKDILEIVKHQPYLSEFNTLTSFFTISDTLGEDVCIHYQINYSNFPYLKHAYECCEDKSNFAILLELARSDSRPVCQLLKTATTLSKDSFNELVIHYITQPKLRPLYNFILEENPSVFAVPNIFLNNPRFMNIITKSKQSLKAFEDVFCGKYCSNNFSHANMVYGRLETILDLFSKGHHHAGTLLRLATENEYLYNKLEEIIKKSSPETSKSLLQLADLLVHLKKSPYYSNINLLFSNLLELHDIKEKYVKSIVESALNGNIYEMMVLTQILLSPDDRTPTSVQKQMVRMLDRVSDFNDIALYQFMNLSPENQNTIIDYVDIHGLDEVSRGLLKLHCRDHTLIDIELLTKDSDKKRLLTALLKNQQTEKYKLVKDIEIPFYHDHLQQKELLLAYVEILTGTPQLLSIANKLVEENSYIGLEQLRYLSAHDLAALQGIESSLPIADQINALFLQSSQNPEIFMSKALADPRLVNNKAKLNRFCRGIAACAVMENGSINAYTLNLAFKTLYTLLPEFQNSSFEAKVKEKIKMITEQKEQVDTVFSALTLPHPSNPLNAVIDNQRLVSDREFNVNDVRESVLSAMLLPLRQHQYIGSCFATQSAIVTQCNLLDQELQDYKSLIEKGALVREVIQYGMRIETEYPSILMRANPIEENRFQRCREYTIASMEKLAKPSLQNKNLEFYSHIFEHSTIQKAYPILDNNVERQVSKMIQEQFRLLTNIVYDPETGSGREFGGWTLQRKDSKEKISTPEAYAKLFQDVLQEIKNQLIQPTYLVFGDTSWQRDALGICELLIQELNHNSLKFIEFLLKSTYITLKNPLINYKTLKELPWTVQKGGYTESLYEVNSFKTYITETGVTQTSTVLHATPNNFIPLSAQSLYETFLNYALTLPAKVTSAATRNSQYRIPFNISSHACTLKLNSVLTLANKSPENVISELKQSNNTLLNQPLTKENLDILLTKFVFPNKRYQKSVHDHLRTSYHPAMTIGEFLGVLRNSILHNVENAISANNVLMILENILQSEFRELGFDLQTPTPVIDTNWIDQDTQNDKLLGFGLSLLTQEILVYDVTTPDKPTVSTRFPTFQNESGSVFFMPTT